MALKTFNLDAEVYRLFSEHCKREGISMSKKIEKFIRQELEALKKGATGSVEISLGEHSFKKYC